MASVRSSTYLVSFSVEKQAAPVSLRLNVAAPSRASPPPVPKAKRQRLWRLTNDKVFQNDASR